jgi:hypothetical protein
LPGQILHFVIVVSGCKTDIVYFFAIVDFVRFGTLFNYLHERVIMFKPSNDASTQPDEAPPSARRRTVLFTLMGAALAGCGGSSSGPGPTPAPSMAPTLTSSMPPTSPGPARLTLDGTSMLSPDGKSIVLRGINEGTWGKMQSIDAAQIAGQGANVVRVLIRWWGHYGRPEVDSRPVNPENGPFEPGHLEQFLREVQWCLDAGMWVVPVLESDCGQNGLQDAQTIKYCDPDKSYPLGHNFWTDLSQRELYKQAWVHLAGILKNYPRIAFYELLPEPLGGHDASYVQQVSDFYKELMIAIEEKAGDKRTPFLIGPRDAYNIELCDEAYLGSPRWTNRVVYTGNLFIWTGKSEEENIASLEERLGALKRMRNRRNVPVFIQQLGVRSGDDPTQFYLDAALKRVTSAGIGYTGWQWRQNTSRKEEFAIVVEDADTGADWVNWPVLNVYSRYWRA